MNIRLVDPATWTVVRKYRNVLEACAAPAGESAGLIWAEADDDDAAVLQARAKVGAATLREAAEGIAKAAPAPDRLAVDLTEIERLRRRAERAERSLVAAGYTDEGGEAWKPPLGPSAAPLLARIDALTAEVEALRAERDAFKATVRDEIDANLRLRELGGARPDEGMTAYAERLIAERDALRAEVEALRAKRVPLTDGQIKRIAHQCGAVRTWSAAVPFARAIERAHGIDAASAEARDNQP